MGVSLNGGSQRVGNNSLTTWMIWGYHILENIHMLLVIFLFSIWPWINTFLHTIFRGWTSISPNYFHVNNSTRFWPIPIYSKKNLRVIHTNWNSIWHIYSDILFGILSDIYSDILCDILSDIYWDIIFGILSDIYSDILAHLLTFFLAFYRISLRRFFVRSGRDHFAPAVAVRVRRGPLRSRAFSWGRGGWGGRVGNGRVFHSHSSQVATAKAMMVSASHVVSVLRGDIHTYVYIYIYIYIYIYNVFIYIYIWLVVSTPLKNTSSSVGMMTFPI